MFIERITARNPHQEEILLPAIAPHSPTAPHFSEGDPVSENSHLDRFADSLRARKMSLQTLRAYLHDARKFVESCPHDLAALQPSDIERYIERLAQSGARFSTVKRTLSALREFFRSLADRGKVEQNPAEKVRISPAPRNLLSSHEVLSLFHVITRRQRPHNTPQSLRDRRDELILLLMVFHGVRQYQIPTLRLSAIERTDEFLALRVNEKLSVKLSGKILHKLREYLLLRNSPSDAIFLDPFGGLPISPMVIHLLLRELSLTTAIRCSSSSLYHTFLRLHNDPDERNELLSSICSSDNHDGLSHLNLHRGVAVDA